jgi:hypothetical protein
MSHLRGKLTYSNVISTLCLFLVLGGGAWAASTGAFHSVGKKQLRPNAVNSRRVENGTLRPVDLSKAATPPGAGGDLGSYVGVQQGAMFLPREPTKVAAVNVPMGRYFITVSAQLAATDDTPGSRPNVDCDIPGAEYGESLPDYVAARTLSFSAVSYVGPGENIELRCGARSQSMSVQIANTQVDALFVAAH